MAKQISDTLSNVVENVACRIAEHGNGRVAPPQVLPYLPMSLELVREALDGMADGTSVLRDDDAPTVEYAFTAYQGEGESGTPIRCNECVSCGGDLSAPRTDVLCNACRDAVRRELTALAESVGWPAQAVYEHEIFYLAASQDGDVHAEDLAGRSRYTLRNMRRKLDRLSVAGFVRQDLDSKAGLLCYRTPPMVYPKDQFRRNMEVIRSYPASHQEDLEMKVVRIFMALSFMVIAMLVLAFMRVPFPLLVLGFAVLAPIVSISILRRRTPVLED